jgi:ABC-type transporter Mla subunit MlaD
MAQPDALGNALQQLQQSLGDAATLNNIIIGLRENTDRLLEPLKSVLEETRDAIDRTLTLL